MKYCPYCGATLMGGAVSFCAECGKSIALFQTQNEALRSKRSNTSAVDQKKHRRSMRLDYQSDKANRLNTNLCDDLVSQDDGYDGYYDDVCTLDNGHEKEGMDPELIKKIILISGIAILVIIMAIAIMLVF